MNMVNKRGVTMFGLIVICFVAVFFLIGLAIISFSVGKVDDTVSTINFSIGNTSFNQQYNESLKPALNVLENNFPQQASVAVLIGMILCLLLVAYKAPTNGKMWIIYDIFIMIVAEIFAVAISTYFQSTILNISPDLFNIFTTTLSGGSRWIISLPIVIPVTGVLILVVSYILKKETPEEAVAETYDYEEAQ